MAEKEIFNLYESYADPGGYRDACYRSFQTTTGARAQALPEDLPEMRCPKRLIGNQVQKV